jgi:hypothetical protein
MICPKCVFGDQIVVSIEGARAVWSFNRLTLSTRADQPLARLLSDEEWQRRRGDWLRSSEHDAFVASLMKPCYEPGKFASWIAPPRAGKPGDFEYVRLDG